MTVETINTLIGSMGFPIVCCLVMFYQNSKLQETLTELTKTLASMNDRIADIESKLN